MPQMSSMFWFILMIGFIFVYWNVLVIFYFSVEASMLSSCKICKLTADFKF